MFDKSVLDVNVVVTPSMDGFWSSLRKSLNIKHSNNETLKVYFNKTLSNTEGIDKCRDSECRRTNRPNVGSGCGSVGREVASDT